MKKKNLFISLSKLKGLIQYINYQDLYYEDIRKISYYIKYEY